MGFRAFRLLGFWALGLWGLVLFRFQGFAGLWVQTRMLRLAELRASCALCSAWCCGAQQGFHLESLGFTDLELWIYGSATSGASIYLCPLPEHLNTCSYVHISMYMLDVYEYVGMYTLESGFGPHYNKEPRK